MSSSNGLIGSPPRDGDFVLPQPVNPIERDFLREKGIPSELISSCSVMDWVGFGTNAQPTPDSRIDLRVGGQHPQLPLSDILIAVDLGLGVRLALADHFDLFVLEPVFERVHRLGIAGEALVGWSSLERSSAVADLILSAVPPGPIDLSYMPNLRSFDGFTLRVSSVLQNEALDRVVLDVGGSRSDGLPIVRGQVRHAQFQNIQGLVDQPSFVHPEVMEVLRLYRPKQFDMRVVLDMPNLKWLDLGDCARILNIEVLQEAHQVERLDISGIRSMDRWESLDGAPISILTISKNYVIPGEEARLLSRREGWSVEAKRPLRGAQR